MGQITLPELKILVSETTQKIQAAKKKTEINRIVENLITHVMDTDYASLWVFDKETASLVRARDDDSINEISMLGQHGVLAKCFFTLNKGIFNYIASEKEYLPKVDNPDNIRIKSKIIVPIIDNEHFLGMVTAYSSVKKIKNFTPDDLSILEALVPFLINIIYLMYPELKHQEEKVYVSQRLLESSENIVEKVEEVQQQQQQKEEGEQTLNFLANTVHDIRTPANSLFGFLELMEDQIDDNRLLQYIHNAKESARFINELTTSILDRISSQRERIKTNKETVNPTRFLADTAETFSANMYNKQITYNIFIDPALPKEIHIDTMMLKRVIMNLLNNAYKFTPTGGKVNLLVQYIPEKQKVKIAVNDTGIGIAPEKQTEIFKAFTQAEEQTKEQYGGTGLGLAICAEYVSSLGGKLKLKSQLDKGSSFYFSIPLEIVNPDSLFTPIHNTLLNTGIILSKNNLASAQNIARYLTSFGISKTQFRTLGKRDTIPDGITHLICYENMATPTLKAEALQRNIPLLIVEENFLSLPQQQEDTVSIISQYGYYAKELHTLLAENQPLKILVADDDKINLELIKAILADEFCHIDTATSGKDALEMLKTAYENNTPYQIAYLDKQMPALSGAEVIRQYRQLEKEKTSDNRLFAISISGDGRKDQQSAALFEMFVGKPFNKKAIQETVELAKKIC